MDIPLDTRMSPVEERTLRIVRHGEGHFSPFVRPVLAVTNKAGALKRQRF